MSTAPDNLFRALSDPTRRSLFERLIRDGEQTVVSLTERAGVSQPAVSKHLALLKVAGLVKDRRAGRSTYYAAEPQGLAPLFDWMNFYGAFWKERFASLESLLERMDDP